MEFIACPWCGQRNPINSLECRQCGGPLPPPIGDNPGPEPPLPPRVLPKGYRRRMLWKNSILNTIGIIFTAVGLSTACLFSTIGITAGIVLMALIGLFVGGIFAVIGGGMLYAGIREALGKIRPYERGLAATGEVTEIYRDRSTVVNGRNPWAVHYQFNIGTEAYEGRAITWKYAPAIQEVGNRVWVLYLPDDPEQNVLYPPLG